MGEGLCRLGRVGDGDEAVGAGVDDFLAGVGRPATLYQVPAGHFVGPVDGEVHAPLVQVYERDADLAGEFP